MPSPLQQRYLLLQIRNPQDPIRRQEVECFARALDCSLDQITVWDLLSGRPGLRLLRGHDAVLIGGSGDYSVLDDGPWLQRALHTMQQLVQLARPTFASCWGFQALALALGGRVARDPDQAEVGTHAVHMTPEGMRDPVFAGLGNPFLAQMGHEDSVIALPPGAVRLARSERAVNQAYRLEALPIYATQFHPELDRQSLWRRVVAYPQYVRRVGKMTLDRFAQQCRETPEAQMLLRRFTQHVLRGS